MKARPSLKKRLAPLPLRSAAFIEPMQCLAVPKLVSLLKQVKGVGTQIGLTYVLTIEDPYRFPKGRAVGCFLGLRNKSKLSPRIVSTKPMMNRLVTATWGNLVTRPSHSRISDTCKVVKFGERK